MCLLSDVLLNSKKKEPSRGGMTTCRFDLDFYDIAIGPQQDLAYKAYIQKHNHPSLSHKQKSI